MAAATDEHREDGHNHRDSAQKLEPKQWARTRTFHHSLYSAGRIARERSESVSVCVPAKECAGTVAKVVGELVELREAGAIDEVMVVDAASADGTAAVAAEAGATVRQEAELMPHIGPVLGKGDAMWRALGVTEGEIVCYLDADTEEFSAHFATGLLGPLVCEQGVEFVKAFYKRPFEHGGIALPEGGGRVNHLTARPALALFYPQLAEVRQPLAGEVAARRGLLERLPFATGYGVEIGMLIDAWRAVGLEALAQVDLEVHRNRHQPLAQLTPMATTVLATIARRLRREGRLTDLEGELAGPDPTGPNPGGPDLAGCGGSSAIPPERPPLAGVRAANRASQNEGLGSKKNTCNTPLTHLDHGRR
jgi:glucosyl-3-phosphoglycerate synthase